MKTKLNELLEFPTPFTYKVMGQALPELVDQVVEVVQRHAPGDYTPTVKAKATTTRYLSLSTPLISSRLKHCMKNWAKSILSAWFCNSLLRYPAPGRVTPLSSL